MANSKIIIVEGAQGAGKTTITDYIRYAIPHTNLYRLNGISDSSITGYEKSYKMYLNLLNYIKNMENLNINLLFDRTFFTEENYCRLGKKDYSFSEAYYELVKMLDNMDFEIYYITSYLENESLFETRLLRENKAGPEYAKYKAENSIKQQREYLNMSKELSKITKKFKIYEISNDQDLNCLYKKINDIFGVKND
jgi:adenylate kinase family enzyme